MDADFVVQPASTVNQPVQLSIILSAGAEYPKTSFPNDV